MTADSGRLREVYAPAHTGSGRDPSDTSYRVAKRSSDRSSAQPPCPQVLQRHLVVAKGSSIGSSARPPCPQVLQRHPHVAKGAFVKAKGAVLGNIKCDEEAACLQLGCRLSSLFL